ncbi:hypothetical protein T08_3600 [Trichinella sp. T8]|uniref:Uncharacterized protein n=1 Tax=Trichinella murrelli TaxID=144512 RepID=A0A0V0TNI2_9BILA|nr:hypothetical protein T05_13857 [Trichinella murrelli]KRZ93729.1 hypothetical protein T08_3600 [Trichinella sp. T8]
MRRELKVSHEEMAQSINPINRNWIFQSTSLLNGFHFIDNISGGRPFSKRLWFPCDFTNNSYSKFKITAALGCVSKKN